MESMRANDTEDVDPDHITDVFASYVYVLMKKKTRVSRNLRACWFFRHLCTSVKFTPLDTLEDLKEDLNLVSVIAEDPDEKLKHGYTYNVYIGPETVVTFLSWQYRLAFSLDLSPSLMSVDVENGQYVYDGIFQSLSRCLRGLVMPFHIPGSDAWFAPDLYISVIIQTPIVCSTTNQVLIQGVKINQSNISDYLNHIKYELDQFEASLSLSFATMLSHHPKKEHSVRPGEQEEEVHTQLSSGDIGSPEAAFTNIIRYGILSLQLLPSNSSSGIVVITDGIIGLPSSFMVELLLEQLRNHTIMCSFIKVGSPSGLYRQLGRVPHIEMLQTIATATFGAVLSSGPNVIDEKGEANQFHRAMLFWAFQKGLEGFKYELTHRIDEDMPGSISWIRKMLHRHPITKVSFGTDLISKEREKRMVRAGLGSILSVRLREGYTIKSISFLKDKKEIHVKLLFPWRDYGRIEYAATAPWPLENTNNLTHVEVSVEGSYDLLHEILCKNTHEHRSPYRLNNLKTLWTIIEKISATDDMLAHLQSFTQEPEVYQIPDGIRRGIPLFYMQQDGPFLNMQLKESNVTKFAAFWKKVVLLDTNNWQKWMHSHRVGLMLEHDQQLPKYFQVPNASSRFTSVQCRQSLASLSLLLRDWSTFVLAENHSYVKLLYKESDKAPKFFCVLRLTHSLPSLIIRLGFIGGTPGYMREAEMDLLQERIRVLHFPQRGTQKSTIKLTGQPGGGNVEEQPLPHKSPLNREGSEILCCILMTKPVEKILINYDSKPSDMTVMSEPGKEEGHNVHHQPQQQSAMWSMFRTITHYLQHQRWVWDIQASPKVQISMAAISRMLVTITKLRLQEGFNVLYSGAGVTNLVVEVDMKESPAADDEGGNIQTCVVQYIIFPPHIKTPDDGSSNEDTKGEGDLKEIEEHQIVTECWVEPQYGVCCHNPPERKHFNGLSYENIVKAFFPYDHEIVSSLSTFEHLVYLCENPAIPSHDLVSSSQSSPPSTPGHRGFAASTKKEESIRSEPTVNFISFPFDLLSILPRCQQGEILFSSFVIGHENEEGHQDTAMEPNELLFSLFYDNLKEAHDNEILVSADDCHRFMYHILQRHRDQNSHPVPFAYCPDSCCDRDYQFSTSLESDSTFFKTTADKSDSFGTTKSGETKMSSNSASTYATATTCKSDSPGRGDRQARYSRSSSETAKPSRKSDSSHCPLWKCYLKLENPDHLLLTFVPSSFDDLLLLNPVKVGAKGCGEKNDSLSPEISQPADVFMGNSEGNPSLDTKPDSPGVEKSVTSCASTDKATRPLELSLSTQDQVDISCDARDDAFLSPTQRCNERVHEWMTTHTPAVKPKVRGALLIPVYMYSCQLKNVTTSLYDRWSFNLPEDIFEDMSFKPETAATNNMNSPRSHMNTEDKDSNLRHSNERRSTDSFSYRLEAFKEHGMCLSELFLSSYVTGVYQSLQNDHMMSAQDVDAAINNICEESQLLEMDMTSYLMSSCSHFQHLVRRARGKIKAAEEARNRERRLSKEHHEDVISHHQQSIRFEDEVDTSRDEDNPNIPDILQLPFVAVDLANEDGDQMSPHQCQNVKEQSVLDENVQSRFETVIGKNFRAIQSLPYYFFYYPNILQMAPEDMDVDISDKHEDTEFSVVETGPEDDEDVIIATEHGNESGGTSMASNPDNSSLGSSFGEGSSSTNSVDMDKDPMPLFVHLTCTIRQRSNSQHVSVRTVPLCLGEIARNLTEHLEFIDFRDFKVTLDITCLTLVGDEDQMSATRKHLFSRSLSMASQNSGAEKEEDGEEVSSTVNSVPVLNRIQDPGSHLSKDQHFAIQDLKEGIEWVLQEEVISSLRHMFPIRADTLAFVADHIQNSSYYLTKTCLSECVKLQFVHGPEQSLNIFIEQFKQQDLGEYRITREGDFYFVIVNKARSRQLHYFKQLRVHNASNHQHNQIESNNLLTNELAIDREERSLSLPCVLTEEANKTDQILPLASRSLIQSRADGVGIGSDHEDLPRSCCSDEKSIVSARSDDHLPCAVSNNDAKNSSEYLGHLETRSDSPALQAEKTGEASLKKSSSFAGLQRSQARSPNVGISASRSRHRSAPSGPTNQALRTAGAIPQSPSIISSGASTTTDDGEGFDGDVSDSEMDDMASTSDISVDFQELPNFWLLMQINDDSVYFFFHSKTPINEECPSNDEQKKLYNLIKDNALQVCRKVNQTLLLRELYKTKVCNPLLVPEADEDVNWPSQRTRTTSYGFGAYDDEENEESQNQGCLAASLELSPGLFACPVVWKPLFHLHPRLKNRQRGESPQGMIAVQSLLKMFAVKNRQNMFVMEDTPTKNVYYVRLKELQVTQDNTEMDLDASLSDSTYLSLNKIEIPAQTDGDTVSIQSNVSRQTSKVEDYVELSMYGIEEAGRDFIEGLRQMLQKRIDETLLGTMVFSLSRNPQCKLMPEDVCFIQRPQQEPTKTLRLTIPSHCSMYLVSLMYYLRQNLLQHLHTPNYVDNHSSAGHFQDKYNGTWKAIPSHKVFLYNRPAMGGDKGLACISLDLVDGLGQQVKLLDSPSPARYNSPVVNVRNRSEFENLVNTTVHEPPSNARAGPGPTALIQFRIWVCGRCDMAYLCERLQSSVRHATCDIITEYYMLTYPICWVPQNLLDVYAPPVSSLPASPTKLPVVDRGVNPLNRSTCSFEPPKSVTHDKSYFLLFERLSSKPSKFLDFSQAPPDPHSSSSGQIPSPAVGIDRPNMQETLDWSLERQKVAKYEEGETGSLHPVFCSTMVPWMSFCHSIEVPSVSKVKFQFQSRFCVDFVMKELLQSIPTISTDTTLRVFKVLQNTPGDPQGILFTPCKRSAKDSNAKAMIEKVATASGLTVNMLAIGRSLEQWQTMVQDHPDSKPVITTATLRGYRKSQRFPPQVSADSDGQRDSTHSKNQDQSVSSTAEKHFVPRQKLLLILCEKKELTLLLYNWTGDVANQIEKIVGRLIQWNNARSHILDSIVAQKMGLFHHLSFTDLNHTMPQNPYTQSVAEVDSLIRHHAPSKDYQRRHSSLSHKEKDKIYARSRKHMIPFDQTYKNLCAPKALDKLICSLASDPVCRHGIQAQEIRLNSRQDKSQGNSSQNQWPRKDATDEKVKVSEIRDPVFQHGYQLLDTQKMSNKEEERNALRQLYYMGWSQANCETPPSLPVMEEYLTQLKRTGRLFHYCATPLVFCTKWRHSVVQKTVGKMDIRLRPEMSASSVLSLNSAATSVVIPSQATTPATPDKTQKTSSPFLPFPSPKIARSRHSSGTSIVSTKGKSSSEIVDTSRKCSISDFAGFLGKTKVEMEKEETWHYELRRRFLQEYTDYLVTELDFVLFNVKPSVTKGTSNPVPSQTSETPASDLMFNLQKTLAGGIVLIELSFRQEYFCVNMFSIDCAQMQVIVTQEDRDKFVNVSDAYKDLIHVHSFAHDFHLKCVQSYLSNKETFPSGFDLDCFLSDFKQVYPYPPSFSRNCLLEDALRLQDLPFPGHMLYEYMLKHSSIPSYLQDMTMIRMGDKFALVQQHLLDVPPQLEEGVSDERTGSPEAKEPEPYHSSLVIINTSRSLERDPMTLNLKFFTVLTRQRNCHPRLMLEKVSSETVNRECSPDFKKPIDVMEHMKMRREQHVNYRGYSNRQQMALHRILNIQSDQGRGKIEGMVEMSKQKCRRDYLWKRLVMMEETMKTPTDTEESPVLNPLKYAEFCELLDAVTMTPVNNADHRLTPLFNMPIKWYSGLVAVLMTKYKDDHRIRIFGCEGKKQYIVILNTNNLDMFAMLGLKESAKQIEMCMVLKEPLADECSHSPEAPNLPLYSMLTHLEDFVNVCCYHVWASML